MSATVAQILTLVESQAPASLAYAWDKIGLLIGSPRQEVAKVIVTLEASEAVLRGAVAAGANLVLSHHPLIFEPLARFCPDKPVERAIAYAIRHDLAVAAAHTNLDAAHDGLNAYLAQVLGLSRAEPLEVTKTEALLKLAVFVPVGYEDRVREAICRTGAGVIGNYSHCTFTVRGQGTYLPLTGAQPWRGQMGALNRAAEVRLEIILPQGLAAAAVAALKEAHPYEEVAYDLYPLENPGRKFGIGRIGEWPRPRPFAEVAAELKRVFQAPVMKVVGRPRDAIQRVAVCGGSGGELIPRAWEKGAQLYITGDIRYHQAVPWIEEDMVIVDLGHFATEVLFIPEWGRRLQTGLEAAALAVEVIVDTWATDPFHYV